MQKKLDYAALAKAREETRQLQIYKADAEMLLRTDADKQRQQEKQHCFAGRSRTGTVCLIRGLGRVSPTSNREISGIRKSPCSSS